MKNFCLHLLLLIIAPATLRAQTPACFGIAAGQVPAAPNGTVTVPVTVLHDVGMASMQFGMQWDTDQLTYQSLDFSNSALNLTAANFNVQVAGRLRFAWFDPGVLGVSLQTGDTLFSVVLQVQPGASGVLPVFFSPASVFLPEFVDDNVEILPPNFVHGAVHVGGGGAPLQAQSICMTAATCLSPQGAIDFTISGGQAPYSYEWEGPGGPLSGGSNLQAAGPGVYGVTVTDQSGQLLTGAFELGSTVAFVSVFPGLIRQPSCHLDDGRIEVQAQSGVPPYTFAWPAAVGSNTNVAANLAPGVYEVTVTDGLGCTAEAAFSLSRSSGFDLDTDMQLPACGLQNGGVAAVVTGGTGPYQFLWNTGATGPAINAGPGLYSVTVTNALGCTESETVFLESMGPNQNWAHNESFACDTVAGTADLSFVVWAAPGISSPVTVTWSTGTVDTVSDGSAFFLELPDVAPGAHFVQLRDAAGCTLFIPITADCAAPDTAGLQSCFSLSIDQTSGQGFGAEVCLPVRARDAADLSALRLAIDWPSQYLAFNRLIPSALQPFLPADFRVFPSQGTLLVDWENAAGVSVPDDSILFEICFRWISPFPAAAPVAFTDLFAPRAVGHGGQKISFAAFDGGWSVNWGAPASACALMPDCTNDGRGGFLMDVPGLSGNDPVSLFQHNSLQWEGDLDGLRTLAAGSYRATLNNTRGALLHIPLLSPGDCIWPGDADRNGAANHHDLLYLGLAFDASGPARAAGNTDWTGQEGADWAQFTALRRINLKNADTDGDGLITAQDTLAIVQNWGKVVNAQQNDPFDAPLGHQYLPQAPTLTIETDTTLEGMSIALPVVLGSATLDVDSLHGLAFSVSYDPEFIKPGIRFMPADSWFGDQASELLVLQRNFPEQRRLDVAVTRLDGQPASGHGTIGHLYIVIEDEIFLQKPEETESGADSALTTLLRLSNIQAVRPDERPRPLLALDAPLAVRKLSSGVSEENAQPKLVQVLPNPANETLWINTLTSDRAGMHFQLISAAGVIVRSMQLEGPGARLPVNVSDLPSGLYVYKALNSAGKMQTGRVMIGN